VDSDEDRMRKEYPDVFSYVDIINGTIVSIGTHPSGCLVSDLDINETIGMCSISTSDYPVSMLNMKELDDLMYVKLDILGLDNVGVINETCKILGTERMTPDNVDLNDEAVWKSIRDDTTLIFQWESNSAQAYLKKFMSDKTVEIAKKVNKDFSYIKWLSFGNGLIRPGCASFRNEIAEGKVNITGFKELDESLAITFGRITMQEDIMRFCKQFCGYSDAESDTVRRGIAKKKGTAGFIKEIHDRFIEYSNERYGVSKDQLEEIFPPIEQGILDASDYAFSWNHSDAYSAIGYICGYLRYYYPLEFLTAALNIFKDNTEKTAEITKYASKQGIKIVSPKWGLSKGNYFFDKEKRIIAKGVSSVKFLSETVADELYNISRSKEYNFFVDAIADTYSFTSANSRQIEVLIKIDYFSQFGNQRELLRICEIFELFKRGEAKQIKKELVDGTLFEQAVKSNSIGVTKAGKEAKSYTLLNPFQIMRDCEEVIKDLHLDDLNLIIKVTNFSDIMGYSGYTTGNESDRNKLFVRDVFPVRRKKDNEIFAYNVLTQSIGSGIESSMTVFKKVFESEPIKKGDIVQCRHWERDGKYFRMLSYEHIFT
jgi:DNA polymerase-3 subunit alpha